MGVKQAKKDYEKKEYKIYYMGLPAGIPRDEPVKMFFFDVIDKNAISFSKGYNIVAIQNIEKNFEKKFWAKQ